jgi:hypothetical protein
VKDARVERFYAPFGPHAGLAFWLDVTRDWHEKEGLKIPSGEGTA